MGPAELWKNTGAAGSWIAFDLVGSKSNRDGIGACIRLGSQVNCKTSSVGYASSSLTPVHFGLAKSTTVPDAEVVWPSGAKQKVTGLKPGQVVTVREAP